MSSHKTHARSRWKSLYLWHRYIGITVALLVVLLAVTGLMLNHTDLLRLDSRFIGSAKLLNWYGIPSPEKVVTFRAGSHWVSQVGDKLFWNHEELEAGGSKLIGATSLGEFFVVATKGTLLLLTGKGELVESLGGEAGVPAGMHAIGLTPSGNLAVQAAHGYYQTDPDFLEWNESDALAAEWARPTPLPDAFRATLLHAYRAKVLSLERVLLDLHSGRLLGNWGVYLMDVAAGLLLVLAVSGFWIWLRQSSKVRQHRRARLRHALNRRAGNPEEKIRK